MLSFATLDTLNSQQKTILLRLDLNLPIKDGVITDDSRIVRSLSTIKELLDKEAKIVILSHFGRPQGKHHQEYSLKDVAQSLQSYVSCPVQFVDDCIGTKVIEAILAAQFASIIVLENLRFYPGEEANDKEFAQELAKLGEAYVNDAFSCSHRAHASVVAITEFLPSYAGRAMQLELQELQQALTSPQSPVTAIVGGSKVSTKIDLLTNLCAKVDTLIVGGGMANTFLAAQGIDIGASKVEKDQYETALNILDAAKQHQCELVLPVDAMVTTELKAGVSGRVADLDDIKNEEMIVDCGPQTIKKTVEVLNQSATIIWNGPVGVFEIPPFDQGSSAIAQTLTAAVQSGKCRAIAGGGDTLAALAHAGCADGLTYTSTAGGAFLEWLEGKTLPGVSALNKAANIKAA